MIVSAQEEAIVVQWAPLELLEQNGPIEGYEVVVAFTNGSSKVYPVEGNIFNVLIEGEEGIKLNTHSDAFLPHSPQVSPSSQT